MLRLKGNSKKQHCFYNAAFSLCLPLPLSLGSVMALLSHSDTVHLLQHSLSALCCTVIEPYRAAVGLSIVTDRGQPVSDDSLGGRSQWSMCGRELRALDTPYMFSLQRIKRVELVSTKNDFFVCVPQYIQNKKYEKS